MTSNINVISADEQLYIVDELLKSIDDIKNCNTYSVEDIEIRSKAYLDAIEKED